MKRKKQRISFRIKLSIFIVIMVLIPLSIFSFVYLNNKINEVEKLQTSELEKQFSDECLQLKTEVFSFLMKSELVKYDSELNILIKNLDKMNLSEKLEIMDELRVLSDVFRLDDKNCQVRWYTNQINNAYGIYCYPLEELSITKGADLLTQIFKMKLTDYFFVIDKENQVGKENTELKLYLYTKVYESNNEIVVFELSKSLKDIKNMFGDDSFEGSGMKALLIQNNAVDQLIIVSNENEGRNEQLVSDYLKNGEISGYYSFMSDVDELSQIKFISIINKELLLKTKMNLIKVWVLIVFLFCCILFSVAYVTSYIFTKKGIEVVSQLNDYLNNESGKIKNLHRSDIDFDEMEEKIFELMQKVQAGVVKIAQIELEKKELELELLQMNFTPHLLYNTLLSIRYHTDSTVLKDTIASLIHYYQLVLNHGKLSIHIEDEMSMIEEYLNLMIFTYNLQYVFYEIHIEEGLKGYVIPKGVLQPIVENALEHGIRKSKEKGLISIRARTKNQGVIIEIEDDGCGMSMDELDKVLLNINNGNLGDSYGLYNVQKRIKTMFGSGYGMTIQSSIGKGTCVTIRFPQQ